MTDREMLELAAKAAKITVEWDDRTQQTALVDGGGWAGWWNPLQDDGDALRLAVKLNMQISFEPEPDGPIVLVIFAHLPTLVSASETLGEDSYAATRRAITRAAAEIGKAMP